MEIYKEKDIYSTNNASLEVTVLHMQSKVIQKVQVQYLLVPITFSKIDKSHMSYDFFMYEIQCKALSNTDYASHWYQLLFIKNLSQSGHVFSLNYQRTERN